MHTIKGSSEEEKIRGKALQASRESYSGGLPADLVRLNRLSHWMLLSLSSVCSAAVIEAQIDRIIDLEEKLFRQEAKAYQRIWGEITWQ